VNSLVILQTDSLPGQVFVTDRLSHIVYTRLPTPPHLID